MRTCPGNDPPPRFRAARPIAGAGLAAALCLATGAAHAFDIKLGGQLNRLLMEVDDGVDARRFHADNVNSQTRLRLESWHDFAGGPRAGINWEVGYTHNPSSRVSMTAPSIDATRNKRHAEIYLSGERGKLSFGQGDGAANGGMENDLSGTTVINYSGITDIGGSFTFRSGAAAGPTVSSAIGNLDFESRYPRLRYDTPAFGPLRIATSQGRKDEHAVTELAAWFDAENARGRLAAALGWSRERKGGGAGNEDTFGGSVSWLAPGGLNLTLGAGSNADASPTAARRQFIYGKVGYRAGPHAVALDLGQGSNFKLAGDTADVAGIGYVFTAAKWLELYAGAKRHRLDRARGHYADIDFVAAGARLRF